MTSSGGAPLAQGHPTKPEMIESKRPLDTVAEPQKVIRKRGRAAGAKNKST
jgi:hypothetical protein